MKIALVNQLVCVSNEVKIWLPKSISQDKFSEFTNIIVNQISSNHPVITTVPGVYTWVLSDLNCAEKFRKMLFKTLNESGWLIYTDTQFQNIQERLVLT